MKQNKNTFWEGMFFLACSLLLLVNFILGQIGLDFHFSIIKLIFTILFVCMIMDGIRKVDFYSILLPASFIFIMYGKLLGIRHGRLSIFFVALFAAIGLSILFPAKKRKEMRMHMHASQPDSGNATADSGEQDSQTPHFTYKNYFNSSIRYVNCADFLHGNIENLFGSMKIYFDNAVICGTSATLDIDVAFGSLVLYIPSSWQVQENIQAIGASVRIWPQDEDVICPQGPILYIHGDATFASVAIRYI